MTYAPKILDNLLDTETKNRILETLKTKGKVAEEDIDNTIQLVHNAFGGEREAAIELAGEGFQYYLLLTKVIDNTKPFEIEENPKKKKRKLTMKEIYNNFMLEFPETKNYLDLILKLKANDLIKESLNKRNTEDIIVFLTNEVFSKLEIPREEAVQFVKDSNSGFKLDVKREVVTVEDINYCFETDLLKIKLLIDFTKLKLMEIIHARYEVKAKEAEEQLVSFMENTI